MGFDKNNYGAVYCRLTTVPLSHITDPQVCPKVLETPKPAKVYSLTWTKMTEGARVKVLSRKGKNSCLNPHIFIPEYFIHVYSR